MTDADEFRKRYAETPDKWTLAWWSKQFQEVLAGYRGATHSMNRAVALYDDFVTQNEALRKRCEALEKERDEYRAKIGELQATISALTTRVGRMAEFLNSQRKNGSKEPTL